MSGYAFGMLTLVLINKINHFELNEINLKKLVNKEKWPKPPTTNMIYKKYKGSFPGLTKQVIRNALKK
jgi:hypothetical protein